MTAPDPPADVAKLLAQAADEIESLYDLYSHEHRDTEPHPMVAILRAAAGLPNWVECAVAEPTEPGEYRVITKPYSTMTTAEWSPDCGWHLDRFDTGVVRWRPMGDA